MYKTKDVGPGNGDRRPIIVETVCRDGKIGIRKALKGETRGKVRGREVGAVLRLYGKL